MAHKRAGNTDAHEARDRNSKSREAGGSQGDDRVIEIGAGVHCSNGPCGQVRCVVIDPVAEDVTHIVVEAKHPRARISSRDRRRESVARELASPSADWFVGTGAGIGKREVVVVVDA